MLKSLISAGFSAFHSIHLHPLAVLSSFGIMVMLTQLFTVLWTILDQSNRHRQDEALKPYWRESVLFLSVKGIQLQISSRPQCRVRADSLNSLFTVCNKSFFSLIIQQTTFIFNKLLIYYCNLERMKLNYNHLFSYLHLQRSFNRRLLFFIPICPAMWAALCPLLMFPGRPFSNGRYVLLYPQVADIVSLIGWKVCRQIGENASLIGRDVADMLPTTRHWWLRYCGQDADNVSLIGREVANRLPTTRRWLAERLPTSRRSLAERLPTSRRSLAERLPTTRRWLAERLPTSRRSLAKRLPTTRRWLAERLPTSRRSLAERLPITRRWLAERLRHVGWQPKKCCRHRE